MRHIVERCEASGKPFRTLPQLHDMVSGRASMNALREVKIDDLRIGKITALFAEIEPRCR
jgi:FlaA1/EpsC-like NDP-sugar epimerase